MNLEEIVPERFRVFFVKDTNVFKILDTWHQAIKNLNLDENPPLPEDSPAIKNITSEEVNAIVGELIKMGWLDKIIAAKVPSVEAANTPIHKSKNTKDLIVEKIAEITIDDTNKPEQHGSVVKDAISALKEIASNL